MWGNPCTVRDPNPGTPNPESRKPNSATRKPSTLKCRGVLQIVKGAVEPSIKNMLASSHFQFERVGYFTQDSVDSKPDALVKT